MYVPLCSHTFRRILGSSLSLVHCETLSQSPSSRIETPRKRSVSSDSLNLILSVKLLSIRAPSLWTLEDIKMSSAYTSKSIMNPSSFRAHIVGSASLCSCKIPTTNSCKGSFYSIDACLSPYNALFDRDTFCPSPFSRIYVPGKIYFFHQ